MKKIKFTPLICDGEVKKRINEATAAAVAATITGENKRKRKQFYQIVWQKEHFL